MKFKVQEAIRAFGCEVNYVDTLFTQTLMHTLAVIPLALLSQPYFRADVPSYIPYATIGLIFTHEMLHAFDLTGIRYDANGEPKDWFSPESRLRLEARLDCVARQYAASFWKKVSFKGANVDVQVRSE